MVTSMICLQVLLPFSYSVRSDTVLNLHIHPHPFNNFQLKMVMECTYLHTSWRIFSGEIDCIYDIRQHSGRSQVVVTTHGDDAVVQPRSKLLQFCILCCAPPPPLCTVCSEQCLKFKRMCFKYISHKKGYKSKKSVFLFQPIAGM